MTGALDYRHVSILWAGPEHAAQLAELHKDLFEQSWDEGSVTNLLRHPGSISFLARLGQPLQTAGFIMGQLAADEAEILSLGVRKEHQRHGIGRKLVEAMVRTARKAEARRLFLEVAESNPAAVALYERIGFAEIGRRKGYYVRSGARPEDALMLALAL